MGLFQKIAKIIHISEKEEHKLEDVVPAASKEERKLEDIVLAASSHVMEDEMYVDDEGISYRIFFQVNDAFKEAKCHAGEADMVSTYAPEEEYGTEGDLPYLAVQMDDEVYCAVEEFKEKGTFTGAMEITPLSGNFYFKAKMDYYGDIMYFYGMDCCGDFGENNGLCLVYQKEYAGTENEQKLMRVLDEAAESYREEQCNGGDL